MSSIEVRLLSVEKPVYNGHCKMVSVQTIEGEIGILTGHIPMFAALQPSSCLSITEENDTKRFAAVTQGFVSITPELVTVLAESIQWVDESTQSVDVSGLDNDSFQYLHSQAINKAKVRLTSSV